MSEINELELEAILMVLNECTLVSMWMSVDASGYFIFLNFVYNFNPNSFKFIIFLNHCVNYLLHILMYHLQSFEMMLNTYHS